MSDINELVKRAEYHERVAKNDPNFEVSELFTARILRKAAAELTRLREQCEAKDAEIERLKAELEDTQRNYLNVKAWWTGERENRHKHEGREAGMRTEIEELQTENASLSAENERLEAAYKAEYDIVDRIWKQLGSPSYEELNGRSIHDLIDELKAGVQVNTPTQE